jgi:glycosyltransferase involved in cell wall biosynthesis
VICTHNPRALYLTRTLDALRQQTLPTTAWSLLIVDNSSSPPVEDTVSLQWHPFSRIVREPAIGLTHARFRGIRETASDVLVFVDDDNVLDARYLETVLEIMSTMPMLGCVGAGEIVAEFEENPEAALIPYVPMVAIRTVATAHWSNNPADGLIPWGAGMAVSRQVAKAVVAEAESNPLRLDLDRRGDELNSCGDDEFSWVASQLGLGHGLFPELRLLHLIPRQRVQKDYLLRLAEGHAYSRVLFSALHGRLPDSTHEDPSFASVVHKTITLRLESAARELLHLASDARLAVTDRAFRRASRRGARRAAARLGPLARTGSSDLRTSQRE